MNKVSKKQVSIQAVLRSGHENANSELPVRIRVTYDRKSRYYPVIIDGKPLYISQGEWEKLWDKDVKGKELKNLRREIEKVKGKAITARDTVAKAFTFSSFESEFLHQESEKGFFEFFESYLTSLLTEDPPRVGTHVSYKNALVAFKHFRKNRDLKPEEITPEMLKEFDTYLRKEKTFKDKKGNTVTRKACNRTTVGIYMRGMKVIYNYCLSKNPDLIKNYPFSKQKRDRAKYKIKTGSGHKGEALSLEELQAFMKTTPIENTPEWVAKQWWMFSFHCQGMNLRDMCYLRYADVDLKGNVIRYVRRKTKDTEEQETPMEIPLTEPIKEIILSIGNPDKYPGSYLFDVLQKSMSAQREDSVIKQKIKVVNKWLKRLSKEAGLPEVTSYWARHSYANLLKQTGESIEVIRELLGHSDIKTTEVYLKRFDISKKLKVSEKIQALLKAS